MDDCVAAFPSVTPVCAATITTGVGPDEHQIPSMNWYHREEQRYVEYGSSFSASRQFGVLRSLTDTVYRMNAEHLSHDVDTVFESLDDIDVRTAGTTYLIYRGRHQHEVAQRDARWPGSSPRRCSAAPSTVRSSCSTPTSTPAARPGAVGSWGCRASAISTPAASGAYLVEHDLFDFMLFSLPGQRRVVAQERPPRPGHLDRRGRSPDRAIDARRRRPGRVPGGARGDRLLRPLAGAGRGADPPRPCVRGLRRGRRRAALGRPRRDRAQPGAALGDDLRTRRGPPRGHGARALVEVVGSSRESIWPCGAPTRALARRCVRERPGRAAVHPGGEVDGPAWPALERRGRAGRAIGRSPGRPFPSAPITRTRSARIWSALNCPTAGDVLLSAAPGYEFVDWGGVRSRRRRQPRFAAPLGLARSAAVVRHRTRLAGSVASSGHCGTSPR